jgi:hypothetical protein
MMKSPDIAHVYCEHHEDLIVESVTGRFFVHQVKTRIPSNGPFSLKDVKIQASIRRFAYLDSVFPNQIDVFNLVSNVGFVNDDTADSMHALIQFATENNDNQIETSKVAKAKKIREMASVAGVSLPKMANVFRKTSIQEWAGLDDFDGRVIEAVASLEEAKSQTYRSLERFKNHLLAKVWEASSLGWPSPDVDAAYNSPDPKSKLKALSIQTKRIDAENARELFADAITGTQLLVGKNLVPLSEIPKGMSKMRAKLALGEVQIEDNENIEDATTSMEVVLSKWAYDDADRARQRYQHLNVAVREECLTAFGRKYKSDEPFGAAMLVDLRERLTELEKTQPIRGWGLTKVHLLGMAGILTGACKVWWSERIDSFEETGS